MTWIVFTVGLNPLPCLIEIYRLCKKVQGKSESLPVFLPIRDRPRNLEAERVRHYLNQRLSAETGSPVSVPWEGREQFLNNPHDPNATRRDAKAAVKRIPKGATVYFAFTGGTKVMSLETFAALQEVPDLRIIPAYLSASDHRVLSEESLNESSGDERYDWNLQIDVLADLHRLKFQSTPSADPNLEELSRRMLALLDDRQEREWYWSWHKHTFRQQIHLPDRVPLETFNWPATTINWASRNPRWQGVTELITTAPAFGGGKVWKQLQGSWQIQSSKELRDFLIPLYRFFENQFLEIYVWRALRALLPAKYPVEHSVTCRSDQGRTFELDVAAVLGYQLLVVSCTYSSSVKVCKQKGFEVIHRARQLGGDQAQAALVCLVSEAERPALEDDLNAEMGLIGQSLRLFGATALRDVSNPQPIILKHQLREYLAADLKWREF